MFPGSPATPDFAWPVRVAYGCVGLVVGFTGSMGMQLVTVNLASIQGSLGLDPAEVSWLPTAFLMSFVSMNLLLVKFRQQFGLRLFAELALWAYVASVVAHLFVNDFASALAVRFASGAAGAALTTLSVFYMMQAFPAARRLSAIVVGIGAPLLAMPAARLISPDLLEVGQWRALYVIELALALLSLAGVLVLKLPPSQRIKVFERLDLPTFVLLATGLALICAVLGQGRVEWWFEASWMGWALAAAVVLITAGVLIETGRENPLVDIRWILTPDFIGLVVMLALIRIILSEQIYGAVGLLQSVGMGPYQLRGLFLVVLLATAAGFGVSAWLIGPKTVLPLILASIPLVALAAVLDMRATNLTRPEQLYLSQAMVAFAAALFLGPALLVGIIQVLQRGWRSFTTLIVLFGLSQNLGGLVGVSGLGTFQTIRARDHYLHLTERLDPADPFVAGRLQGGFGALNRQALQEAAVLAFNDVFLVIVGLSALALLAALIFTFRALARMRAQAAAAATPAPTPSRSPVSA